MNRYWAGLLALATVAPQGSSGVKEIQHQRMMEIAEEARDLKARGLTGAGSYATLDAMYAQLSREMGGDDPGQQVQDGQPAVDGRTGIALPDPPGLAPPAPFGCQVTTIRFQNTTPLAIPATVATVVSTITVSGAGPVLSDVDVTTFLTHTFPGDLDITLRSPAGTVVTLTTDNGAGNDNVFNGTVWDDGANPGGQVPYITNGGLVTDHPYVNLELASPLVPEEALGAFIGENPNGIWTMTISDDTASDGGSLDSWALAISTFPSLPRQVSFTAANVVPLAIPTGPAAVTSTINVVGAGTSIADVDVTTFITHTFAGDLDITLQSPAGTIVTLTSDNGAGSDNVFNGTVWNDTANPAGQVPYLTNNGLANDHAYVNLVVAPTLVPEDALAAFIGENPNGIWTITISDDLAADGGSLTQWSLNITTGSCTAPVAAGDAYATPFGTPLNVATPGVLANDNGYGGGAMTALLVTGAAHGTATLNASGGFVYTPHAGYAGTDSFTYQAWNALGPGGVATVTLTVNAGAPTTANDTFSTAYLTPLTLTAPGVLVNDSANGGGALTAELVSGTSHGTLTLSPTGAVSYTPNALFVGNDSFTYRAVSAIGPGNVATATITVNEPTTVQPPFNLRVESVVGTMVTLRWDAVPVGPQASTFVLEGGVAPGEVLASIPTGSPSPIYSFVAPTGSFHIRMHGQLASDKSGPSNEVPLHVNVPVPPSAPANLLGTAAGTTLDLTWKNTFGGGAPTGLLLDVSGATTATLPMGPAERFSFTPMPGGTYTFRLFAANAGGQSAASDPVTLDFPAGCTGVPHAPVALLGYRVGSTAYVVWDPPSAGAAPTGYVLNVSGAWVGSVPTTGRSLSGVVGPGTYHLSLVATNACGTSAAATGVLVVP